MKTVKAKLKGTDVTFEGSICDGYFYVSCDHNDFYRLNLDEIEICKDSLQVPETCKENTDSFTSLEEAAEEYRRKSCNAALKPNIDGPMPEYGGSVKMLLSQGQSG